ncbi:MAG: HupE/UreJ family protein, partial [Polyangiaceae bacterium]|nr:HupE/UreJ family protein [Polyangiaceae bacterium]
ESFIVPARTLPAAAFVDYLGLGIEHLFTGLDHVLFVLSLLFVLTRTRALVAAVTSFTVGHSASLALSALDFVQLPSAPVEVAIALSLFMMALEILRRHRLGHGGELERHPALLSGFFGLIHGLGFAGVLAETGLPSGAVPEALFGFNVGIELGQLALIALAMAIGIGARRLAASRLSHARPVAAYVIGSLAAMWVLERGLALVS